MNKNAKEVKENLTLNTPTIYHIIAKEGEEELNRPYGSLFFSGIAAGICISFSLFTMGYLSLMTDNPLIIAFGYCFGFLMVIKGRLQLFTENTIKVILPLLRKFSARNMRKTARLWGIVFGANIVGTGFSAFLVEAFNIVNTDQLTMFLDISQKAVDKPLMDVFWGGIPAGFILAAMVWMLPSAQTSRAIIVIMMTYLISIGHFSHVVAGSTEAFLLAFHKTIPFFDAFQYIGAAGLGNIVGGTVLFSMLAYAQSYKEL